ncbi:MAG TPA: hypothetical protein VEU96_17660 [Bryobacteraceae bacterium]|nr:hypothetical protein [Bryobacteraceae bacterium]
MIAKSCCDPDTCIRREISSLLDPDSPIVDSICVAAYAVAMTCGERSKDELHDCASKLFDVAPQRHVANAFEVAYHAERDARLGRMENERQHAEEFR